MAIFRAETKHITRGKKHNAVAAAAYRSGEKLTDTNKFNPDAKTHDYTKKKGVLASGIILPKALMEKNFVLERQQLWSGVEQHETTTRSVKGSRLKQSARLAREWLLALPHELSNDENEELTREFTKRLVNDLGVIADYAIHEPSKTDYQPKKDSIDWYDFETGRVEKVVVNDIDPIAPNSRNVHAHIMFTTRKATLDANNSLVFGDKADSERSEKWRQEQGMVNGGDYLKEIRELWADMINRRLEQKNILPVSAKSYQDLGLDIIPQHKQGKNASAMALYGFTPHTIGLNHDIKRRNNAYLESTADRCIATKPRETEFADKKANEAADGIAYAGGLLSSGAPTPFDSKRRIKELDEQTSVFDRLTERADKVLARASRVVRKLDTPTKAPTVRLGDRLTNELNELYLRHDHLADKIDSGRIYERECRPAGENFFIAAQITVGALDNAICRVPDRYDMEKYETVYQAVEKLMGSIEQRMEDVGLNNVKQHADATDKLLAMRKRLDTHAARIDAPAQPQQQLTPRRTLRP